MGRTRAFIVATAVAVSTGSGVVPLTSSLAPVAPAGAAVDPTPTVDPSNRASVLAAYQSSLVEARAVPTGWTGNASTCTRGTESAASIDATRAAVNFYRALNRLPAITMNPNMNSEALDAALLMQANGTLDHTPPTTWRCYTQARADAAASSNLSQGSVGAGAIDAYMADLGAGNEVAGHRRWVLNPRASAFGTGSTTGFNALRVFGSPAARPAGVSWVAWPNAGFVPKRALRPFRFGGTMLFSLSSNQHPTADYSAAAVTVRIGSTDLAVTEHPVANGYGDNTLTYSVALPTGYDTSDADVRFDITVSGVKSATGATLPPYAYTSTAIVNPAPSAVPGVPTGVQATGGIGQATVTWTPPASDGGSPITGYRITPSIGATAQPTRTAPAGATSLVVDGLTNGTTYTFRVQAVNAVGASAASAPSNAVTPIGSPGYAPYSSWTHLVDQVYRQLLGRLPTASQRSQWVGALQSGNARPGELVASLRTASHQRIVDQVARLYWAYFLRVPDRDGLEHWVGQRVKGVSIGSISQAFIRSSEFTERYGSRPPRPFVELVYQNVLGRPGDADGIDYWTNEITSGRRTRGEVMLGFAESAENRAEMAAEVTVAVLHIMWLDRAPTAAELRDGVAALEGGQSVADYAQTLLPRAAVLP